VKVGLLVYTANETQTNTPRRYEAIRSIVRQAEAGGFDSVWLADHFLYRNAGEPTIGVWECWTVLAALAEATRQIQIVAPLIGLWFPELRPEKPAFLEHPLTGTAREIAAAIRGYAGLGVPHIMFQCWPYTEQVLDRLTEAVRLYKADLA